MSSGYIFCHLTEQGAQRVIQIQITKERVVHFTFVGEVRKKKSLELTSVEVQRGLKSRKF